MTTLYDKIINVISKPSELRANDEILMILAWFINLFKKRPVVFGDIKPDVIKDIIKNCSVETKKPDDIIIRQGDVGDCFYVNLRGKVSIYINHKKHEEADYYDGESSEEASPRLDSTRESLTSTLDESIISQQNKSKKIREKLGNYVTSLGPGEGFGEIALISEDTRTASIIADEETDLMVVNKALYSRCLQETSMRILNQKLAFINNSPFFGNWQPKMKKLLSLCLERDIIPYDSYLGKQGDPADRMYFIISGQAKVTVNPTIHRYQYPKMYPLRLPEIDEKEIIYSLTESRKTSASSSMSYKNIAIKRRNESFAEAEHRLKIRNLEIGIVGPGEISGMCELIFDMPTYMQSIKCVEDCDVYFIYKRSYERLIARRNTNCVSKMKEHAYMKLIGRNSRLGLTRPIELFRSLQYLIEDSFRKEELKKTSEDASPAFGSSNNQRTLLRANHLNFPYRGAYVQPEPVNKPRMSAFRRLSKPIGGKKNRDNSQTENVEKPLDPIEHSTKPTELNINNNNNNIAQDSPPANTNDSELVLINLNLDELENKMKKWHLELGCKKAFVTKLNRVDYENSKPVNLTPIRPSARDLLTGRQATLPMMTMTPGKEVAANVNNNNKLQGVDLARRRRRRSRSNSSYSEENSSDNTANSDNELDFLKFKNDSSRFLSSRSQNLLTLHLQPTKHSRQIQKEGIYFLNSFLTYMNSMGELNDGTVQSSSNNNNNNNNNHDLMSDSSKTRISKTFMTADGGLIGVSEDVSSISLTAANNIRPNESSPVAANDSSLISPSYVNAKLKNNHENKPNNCDDNGVIGGKSAATSSISIVDKSANRKSMHQSEHGPHQYPASRKIVSNRNYVVKRKFSMGQIKIKHTGKHYSKEEYLALKDELKKQTRRYSVVNTS